MFNLEIAKNKFQMQAKLNSDDNKLNDNATNNGESPRDESSVEMSPEINLKCNKRLCLQERLKVIKTYATGTINSNELSKIFNCDEIDISDIIKNRHDILNYCKKRKGQLSLITRVEIIKAVDSNLEKNEICKKFKCSLGQIEKTLNRRDDILKFSEEYSKGSQSSSSSSLQLKNSLVNKRKCHRFGKPKQNEVCDKLSLEERIEVLRVYSPNISYAKLAGKFNCSPIQIKNCISYRKHYIEKYKRLHPEFDENEFLALKNLKHHNLSKSYNKLSYKESVELIKAFDLENNYSKVGRLFGCSIKKAQHIVKNRKAIMDKWKLMELEKELNNAQSNNINESNNDVAGDNIDEPTNISSNQDICNLLSLDERMNVLKAYNRNEFSLTKLSYIFNCSMVEIKNIIFNHNAIIEEYKKQHPEFDENEIKFPNVNTDREKVKQNMKKLHLKKQKELLEGYDKDKNLSELSRLFQWNAKQIKSIVENREAIMKRYEKEHNTNNEEFNSKESNKCDNANIEIRNEFLSNTHNTNLNVSEGNIDNADHNSSNKSKEDIKKKIKPIKVNGNKNCNKNYIQLHKRNQDDPTDGIETYDGEMSNQKSLKKYLTLDDCVEVIKAVDRNLSRQEICDTFKCNSEQIEEFLQKRNDIMKFYEKNRKKNENHVYNNSLTLDQRIDVIKKFYCDKVSIKNLSSMFICSTQQIQKILYRRKIFLYKYKALHPEFSLSGFKISKNADSKTKKFCRNKLNFEKCIEVINAYDQECKNCSKLGRLFNCSHTQIRQILRNREAIIKRFQTEQKKLTPVYCSDNPTDSSYLAGIGNNNDRHKSSNVSDEKNRSKNENNDEKHESRSNRDNENCDEQNQEKHNSNQTISEKYLTLDKCVSIIKAVDIGVDKNDICEMFKCSLEQIESFLQKRYDIMDFYEKNGTGNLSRSLDLEELINVIKTYHRYKVSFHKLASMFNCSRRQIEKAIYDRNTLIDDYKINHPDFDDNELKIPINRMHKTLSLDERVDVVKVYDNSKFTCDKLACMFHCSISQIENILFNRKSVIEEYKKQCSKCEWNVSEGPNNINKKTTKSRYVNKLSLEKCTEVITLYDRDKNYAKLGRLYNCGVEQIKSIIRNRKIILKTYQIYRNSDSQLNNVASNTSASTLTCETSCENSTSEITFKVENMSPTQNTDKSDDGHDNHINLSDSDDVDIKDKVFPIQHKKTYDLSNIIRKSKNVSNKRRLSNISSKLNLKIHKLQTKKSENNNKNMEPPVKLHNTPCWSKLNPNKYVEVIEAFDQKNTISELASRFNCSEILIKNILKNRQIILKTFEKPIKKNLSLCKRIEVIGSCICNNYSYLKLSRIFNCSLKEIKLCLQNRKNYIDIFKKQYPEFDRNKEIKYGYKDITLEDRVKVLKAFDKCPDARLLGYWFSYSPTYILRIVAERDKIMSQKQKEVIPINQLNIFKKINISSYNDITIALKPIKTYADLTHNDNAINIMLELEEHLQIYSTNNSPKMNHDDEKNIEIFSYKNAFDALKPIGDYLNLTKNCDATNKMLQLGKHLIEHNTTRRRSKYRNLKLSKVN